MDTLIVVGSSIYECYRPPWSETVDLNACPNGLDITVPGLEQWQPTRTKAHAPLRRLSRRCILRDAMRRRLRRCARQRDTRARSVLTLLPLVGGLKNPHMTKARKLATWPAATQERLQALAGSSGHRHNQVLHRHLALGERAGLVLARMLRCKIPNTEVSNTHVQALHAWQTCNESLRNHAFTT